MTGKRRGSRPLHVKLRERRAHPPDGQPWVWLTREILESEAWHSAPINTRRVVERLMLEHMDHAGTMNGKLICTFADFQKWGVGRRLISISIRDASDRGLIVVTERGRASAGEHRWPNKYALGWLPMHDGAAALNRWKAWTPKSISPGSRKCTGDLRQSATSPVHEGEPVPVHESEVGKPQKCVIGPSSRRCTTSKILAGSDRARGEERETSPPDGDPPEGPLESKNNFGVFDERILALSRWGVNSSRKVWTKPTIGGDT